MIRININIAIVDMVQHLSHKTDSVEKTYDCMVEGPKYSARSNNESVELQVSNKTRGETLSLEKQLLKWLKVRESYHSANISLSFYYRCTNI